MTARSRPRTGGLPDGSPPSPHRRSHRRSHGRARAAGFAAAVAAAGLLGSAGLPSTAAAAPHRPASPAPAAHRITLITGDVLTMRAGPHGATVAAVHRAAGSGDAARFTTARLGGHTYAFPRSAGPYLGHQLDRALFDVSGRGQAATAQRVVVTYRPGHHHTAVPGVTKTGGSGDTATGTVTSPRAFGRALAAQYAKDRDSATHTTGLFADVAGIAPATGATPPTAQPHFPMHTLTIKGIGRDGKKDHAFAVVVDLDDLRRYNAPAFVQDGVAKVSVPSGPYAIVAQFDGPHLSTYQVVVPTKRVTGDTSVTIDARTATSRLSAKVPRPADLVQTEAGIFPVDARGQQSGLGVLGDDHPVWVSPTTRKPATGDLFDVAGFQFRAAKGVTPGYDYALRYGSRHTIPADQSYAPRAGSLATVDAAYASDAGTHQGDEAVFGLLGFENSGFTGGFDLTTPAHRTNYYNTGPDLYWSRLWDQSIDLRTFAVEGTWFDTVHRYRAGQHLATTWAGQPLHQRLQQEPGFLGRTGCPACRDGRSLTFAIDPFGDNDPGHTGFEDAPAKGLTEQTSWVVSADGTLVATFEGGLYDTVTMPKGARTYQVDMDAKRRQAGLFELSDRIHTTWTVPASASVALPKHWYCLDDTASKNCSVEPLLTNSYHLPVNLRGELASGATKGGLDLGHLAGAKAKLTQVGVEVSYDGGDTWKQAEVTGGNGGHYGLAFTVPAKAHTDGYGAVRLTAKDTAGSTLTQTVHRAFAVR